MPHCKGEDSRKALLIRLKMTLLDVHNQRTHQSMTAARMVTLLGYYCDLCSSAVTVTNQNFFHKKKKVKRRLNSGTVWCHPRLSSRLLCKEDKE